LVASVVTRLEKIEGKRVINISNDGIPQVDSQGVLHATTSAAQGASPEVPLYDMPMGFYPEQLSLPKPTPVRPPPQAGLTAPSGQMVVTPEQLLPLSVVPSTLVQSQNNAYGNVPPMYSTIAHTSPPIPNTAPSYGVPNDVFTDLHRIQNPNQPPVNNLRTPAMQSQLAARNELAQFKEEIANMMKNKLGVDMGNTRLYQKPYRADFDYVAFPPGWRMPDFVKFSGDDNRMTWEHISQYTAQLGEAGTYNSLKVCLFSLSLTGTAFAWFSSLAPNSIDSWDQLEQKFHDHFFSGSYQLKLTGLTSVRQNKEESVSDYLKRFKEVKNRCFNLSLTDSDLADLAARGLRPAIRDRLEGVEFHTLANVLVRGMSQELKLNKEKEHFKSRRSNIHVVEYDSDSSDDENEVYVAEFVWPSKSKASSCASLKPATKGRQEELKFTFDVSKCDRIFDELLKLGNIKISYTMPPLDEIKQHAYCKFHNSYSHATNDCNVFRR
jgi:hypothetical protein